MPGGFLVVTAVGYLGAWLVIGPAAFGPVGFFSGMVLAILALGVMAMFPQGLRLIIASWHEVMEPTRQKKAAIEEARKQGVRGWRLYKPDLAFTIVIMVIYAWIIVVMLVPRWTGAEYRIIHWWFSATSSLGWSRAVALGAMEILRALPGLILAFSVHRLLLRRGWGKPSK